MHVHVGGTLRIAAALGAVGLALCAAAPAGAQTRAPRGQTPATPLEVIGEGLKLQAAPVDPAPFVRDARKPDADLQFMPLAGARPEPARRSMTPDEVRAKEAELGGVRARHDSIAHRRSPPATTRSAAREPIKPTVKVETRCLITCKVDSAVATTVTTAVAPPATTP